ncbi:hypothetical protein EDB85DRAFT_1901374 [Lactarius pseudohatsudake]|nr:hypothetical protein EDB85DRAFT_1901374 [Lactarius pseudohatsudake]
MATAENMCQRMSQYCGGHPVTRSRDLGGTPEHQFESEIHPPGDTSPGMKYIVYRTGFSGAPPIFGSQVLGACSPKSTKPACECSTPGNARDEPLGLDRDRPREWLRTSLHLTQLCGGFHLRLRQALSYYLRARASAARWRTQGVELHSTHCGPCARFPIGKSDGPDQPLSHSATLSHCCQLGAGHTTRFGSGRPNERVLDW